MNVFTIDNESGHLEYVAKLLESTQGWSFATLVFNVNVQQETTWQDVRLTNTLELTNWN